MKSLPRALTAPLSQRSHVAPRFCRGVNGRPGQPLDLTRYDKGASAIPIPPTVANQESELMGQLKPLPAKLNRREVPKQLKDFEQRRQDYNSSLSEIRRQFQSEWSERRKREEAAAEAYRAEVAAGKRQRDAVKALKRTSIVATEAAASAQRAAISAARRQEGVSRELARQVDITAMRRRWLDRLEADSAGWIREDAIDTAITPELFGLKYAWQFERWFEVKESKRQLREDARRAKKPGQPLREVILGPGDNEFAEDWESDGEAEEEVGVGSAAHAARVADAVAASGDPAQQAALAVARRAAREAGIYFVEPAYDADGKPLGDLAAAAASSASAADTGAAGAGTAGIGIAELYHGKRMNEILQSYEEEIAKLMAAVDKRSGSGVSTSSRAPDAAVVEAAGRVMVDDGERPAEAAYIDMCIGTRQPEALFYALLRKRDRLTAGVARAQAKVQATVASGADAPTSTRALASASAYADALSRFNASWGKWIADVGSAVGGVFDPRGSGAGAASSSSSTAAAQSEDGYPIASSSAASADIDRNLTAAAGMTGAAKGVAMPQAEVERVAAAAAAGSGSFHDGKQQ